MQNWEHCSRLGGIEKLVAMPCGSGWPGFSFSITNNAGNNNVRIIHRSPKCGGKRVSQLASFMNRSGYTRVEVEGKSARPGEAFDEQSEPFLIRGEFWVE